jgi:hypothetical protein
VNERHNPGPCASSRRPPSKRVAHPCEVQIGSLSSEPERSSGVRTNDVANHLDDSLGGSAVEQRRIEHELARFDPPRGEQRRIADPRRQLVSGQVGDDGADQWIAPQAPPGGVVDAFDIYPREIEEFLHTMPGVVDAQVVGVPDPFYGEEVMAWVQVGGGVSLTRDDVVAYAAGHIAHFKIPRYVHVTDDFPMTVTGKIQKYKLRELGIDLIGAGSVTR